MHDDSDIKIFKGKSDYGDGSDLFALAEEMKRHILNGNSPKAKELGKVLAEISPDSDDLGDELTKFVCSSVVTPEIKTQIQTLMLFCAEYTLLRKLCPMLSTTATEAMYDALRTSNAAYYDDISNGTAVSFYYLAVKRNKTIAQSVGESFAMLCEAQDNKLIKALGENVFELMCEKIGALIDSYNFEK